MQRQMQMQIQRKIKINRKKKQEGTTRSHEFTKNKTKQLITIGFDLFEVFPAENILYNAIVIIVNGINHSTKFAFKFNMS